mgnify:CR=1 FL=1
MIGRHIIGRAVVNDVLLPHVVPPISQTPICFVSRIGVEVVNLVVDSWRHGVVKRLVIDVVFVITTRIRTTWRIYKPVVLVLALIDTDHRGVVRFPSPFLRLRVNQLTVFSILSNFHTFIFLQRDSYLIHVSPFRGTAAASGQGKRAADPEIFTNTCYR